MSAWQFDTAAVTESREPQRDILTYEGTGIATAGGSGLHLGLSVTCTASSLMDFLSSRPMSGASYTLIAFLPSRATYLSTSKWYQSD